MAPPATRAAAPAMPSVRKAMAPGPSGGGSGGAGPSSGSGGGVVSSMVGPCWVRAFGELELHELFLKSRSGAAVPAGRAAARIDALHRGEGPAIHGLHHRTYEPVAAKRRKHSVYSLPVGKARRAGMPAAGATSPASAMTPPACTGVAPGRSGSLSTGPSVGR